MDHDALATTVLNTHFHTTQFRNGYAEREVDDFLDVLVARLRARASAAEIAATVEAASFPMTGMRRGYEMGEVDDFLDDVVRKAAALDGAAALDATTTEYADAPAVTDADVPSALIEPEPGLGAKLLRMLRGS